MGRIVVWEVEVGWCDERIRVNSRFGFLRIVGEWEWLLFGEEGPVELLLLRGEAWGPFERHSSFGRVERKARDVSRRQETVSRSESLESRTAWLLRC